MKQKLKPLCEWNYHSIGFDRRATVDGQAWIATDHLAMRGEEHLANECSGLKGLAKAALGVDASSISPIAIGPIPSGTADAVLFSNGSALWDRYYIAVLARWPNCEWKSATIRLVSGNSRKSILAMVGGELVAIIAPLDLDPPKELARLIKEATR